jgi:Domain of unknown function (DUF4365)
MSLRGRVRRPFNEGMAPQRPASHVISEEGVASIKKSFRSVGWATQEIGREFDYGEDLLVRIFENSQATPYTFFVQAKSATGTRVVGDGRYLSCRVKHSHLQSWETFWEPVIFAVWDSTDDVTYWELVQAPERPAKQSQTGARLYVPTDNILDPEGLARIAARTRLRHQQLQREQQGAEVLVGMLENLLGVTIYYRPQAGLLAVGDRSGSLQVTVFGRLKERLERLEELSGQPLESLAEDMLEDFADTLQSPGPFEVRDFTGSIRQLSTVAEFWRHLKRSGELREASPAPAATSAPLNTA